VNLRRFIATAITAATILAPTTLNTAPAHAMTMNCQHTGPVVGHPGMEYICYVHLDNGHKESFYAPGPYAGP
jgi:hypothetical protein